jgi:GGDEF domain-containing protein
MHLQVRRGRPVAVFLIGLDRFKSINDRFGPSRCYLCAADALSIIM